MNAVALALAFPDSWTTTLLWALGWTGAMVAFSPVADWLASRVFPRPPTLGAFKPLQKSFAHLMAGLMIAWALGGFLEETVFRGLVLTRVEIALGARLPPALAATGAILVAAVAAGACHFYQGARAVMIVTQLSVLFGALFVLSGHNLWTAILAHGSYDTIAFVRFATGRSKYART